jgi:hypothetical protein
MNEPSPSDPDDFQDELEILRSILQENLQQAKQDPLLGTQLEFWLESAKFLELNIEIWDQAGNAYKENQARERMRKVLGILQELINQMNDGRGMERLDPGI